MRMLLLGLSVLWSTGLASAPAFAQEEERDPLEAVLAELGLPFVPPGFRERFHLGRVELPEVVRGAPPVEPFVPAEWEPAIGVFVVWPGNLPEELLLALADNVPLHVITERDEVETAHEWFSERLDRDRYRILSVGRNSGYPRDYGPQQVFDEAQAFFVEQVTRGAPQFSLEAELGRRDEPVLTLYEEENRDEDVAPTLARELGFPVLRPGAVLTGGNLLVDGLGSAFFSDAQLDENHPLLAPREYQDVLRTYLGIVRPVALENFSSFGIQHIDCWMKVLDAHRVLVMKPPAGHPEEAPTERNLDLLSRARTATGRPWKVLRIETPAVARPREWPAHVGTAAYTNSLILNDEVYVPLYGAPEDDEALETWRRAMPGYEVLGFEWEEWRTFDALHCRTRALFDPDMLRVTLRSIEDEEAGLVARFRIVARSGAELLTDELRVFWRPSGDEAFEAAPLRPDGQGSFAATLPKPGNGARIEYYAAAADASGRRQTLPPVAPAAWLEFPAGE